MKNAFGSLLNNVFLVSHPPHLSCAICLLCSALPNLVQRPYPYVQQSHVYISHACKDTPLLFSIPLTGHFFFGSTEIISRIDLEQEKQNKHMHQMYIIYIISLCMYTHNQPSTKCTGPAIIGRIQSKQTNKSKWILLFT